MAACEGDPSDFGDVSCSHRFGLCCCFHQRLWITRSVDLRDGGQGGGLWGEGAERKWATAYRLRDSQGKAPLAALQRTCQWNRAP